jgi:hypothetical protein
MGLPGELMSGTWTKEKTRVRITNNNHNKETLICTLILHHRWAEKELIHKIS